MRHLQHLKNKDATCAQRFANINEKRLHPEDDRLQHVKNTVTTLIYNNCNIKIPEKTRGRSFASGVPWPWVERRLAAGELRGPRRHPGMRPPVGELHPVGMGGGCAVGGAPPLRPRRTARSTHGSNSSRPAWGRCVRDA
jgi:hypothetical protein